MIGELFQPMHLIVILIVLLFVVGPSKLPQLGASIGKSLREFRRSLNQEEHPAPPAQPKTDAGK